MVHLRVIEFQKRGLPHAHILVILHQDDRIRTSEELDQIVSAEIPPHPDTITDENPEKQEIKRAPAKRLRELVLKHMIHGPCGKKWSKSPCMYNNDGDLTDMCSKKFPKEFLNETVFDQKSSYVKYRRKAPEHGGTEALRNGIDINSAWIVP